MKSNVYCDPQNTDSFYAIVRGSGREKSYFPARIREGSSDYKRIAPSILPVRRDFEEAHKDLENHARRMGWTLLGVKDVA